MTHVHMMKDFVKVYCRLKHDTKRRKELYKIQKFYDFEEITFHHQVCHKNKPFHRFRFHKIFDVSSTQEQLFNVIAKPIVKRVLEGYNGTIFAYGQTGSGKTYTITGSPRKYDDRGIIPRAIQEIFTAVNKSIDKFNIKISYLEIYNEIGYDLLNPQYTASCLEELPRVTFLEDGKGEAHLRNLSVQSVYTEQEAMKLLYLGDRNRSERVYKSNISGVTLNEAKYINLSLHYLEQVILALSQTRRSHVPYRNSMMTLMLKDSLSGNTLTAMLATMATNEKNILETLSTCKFAQRVAMISTEAIVNEERNPQQEIILLKNEIEELKKQIETLTKPKIKTSLTMEDRNECEELIKNFIVSNKPVPFNTKINLGKVEYCFQLMKNEIVTQRKESTTDTSTQCLSDKYQQILVQKDDEISALTMMLVSLQNMQSNATSAKYFPNGIQNLTKTEQEAFDIFLINYQNKDEINFYFNTLDSRYKAAQNEIETIQKCQKEIMEIRNFLENSSNTNSETKSALNQKFICLQTLYKSGMANLQMIKKDIDYLKQGLQQAQTKVIENFKSWYYKEDVAIKEGGDNIMNNSLKDTLDNGTIFDYQNQQLNNKLNCTYSHCCATRERSCPTIGYLESHMSVINKFLSENQSTPTKSNNDIFSLKCLNNTPEFSINDRINTHENVTKAIPYNVNKENSNIINLEQYLNSANYVKQTSVNNKNIPYEYYNYNYRADGSVNNLLSVPTNSNNPYMMRPLNESIATTTTTTTTSSNIDNLNEDKRFKDFIKNIPLTGDHEVDEEIIQFYRNKFNKSL